MTDHSMIEPVDPALVPRQLIGQTGDSIPAIGLGTFGSDHITAAQIATAVSDAIQVGYRHIDCAAVYGNEAEIGQVLNEAQTRGVARDELWVTSKVWNDRHHEVEASCEASLRDLQLDHLDLFLVHWPFPNHHDPGVSVEARHADAQPYVHERYMETWAQMERLVDRGLVRHIGTSNMTVPKLELVLRDATIAPAANEMELHPHFQQPDLFDTVTQAGIVPIGYSPLGSPARPERDRTDEDSAPLDDPIITDIAKAHGVHPATIAIRWAVQRGQIPIPFSTTQRNYHSNLLASIGPVLSSDEMASITAADRDCRLIKGQVFLWREGQDWQDLWDPNGIIPT